MNRAITIGGIGVIAAVLLICLFILWQVVPLFRSTRVEPAGQVDVSSLLESPALALGMDEWGELPFVLTADGTAAFVPPVGSISTVRISDQSISASAWDAKHQRLIVTAADGIVAATSIRWTKDRTTGADGSVSAPVTVTLEPAVRVALAPGRPLTSLGWAEFDGKRVVAGITGGATSAVLVKFGEEPVQDLTDHVSGIPQSLLVEEHAAFLLVATQSGEVVALSRAGSTFTRLQAFTPFADTATPQLSQLFFLFGDTSVVAVNRDGLCRQFSLYIKPGADGRSWGMTKEFADLPTGSGASAISLRNKCFLVSGGKELSLRHGTSAVVRWSSTMAAPAQQVALNAKYTRIATLGEDRQLRFSSLHDPHPEAGFAAYFLPVWYEGYPSASFQWQSTGGTDDFEPKLSMITLIFGTLKATLYTLVFAVPVALLAAIYTAEFMHPRFKSIVKPTVEIMASLPSVVLGFLAALWLAPLIEHRVPSVIAIIVAVPTMAFLLGWWWSRRSPAFRSRIPTGYEFLVLVPLLLASTTVAWQIGVILDPLVFHYTVPGTAADPHASTVHGFAAWWRQVTGLAYEQRNSLVVGVMMGFAVIPIIFTIAEDALSNVPTSLRSASLACGASRWQTAIRVVVPTASAGIFSGLMIGLGRAIGETMIVVMATGNTGIIDLNLFNGMRTLSANIAVELPEAPHGGTLYRTLFLGALLLFIFTFVINTVAEVMRQRLREKYKTV